MARRVPQTIPDLTAGSSDAEATALLEGVGAVEAVVVAREALAECWPEHKQFWAEVLGLVADAITQEDEAR